jgi:hypothetical protein
MRGPRFSGVTLLVAGAVAFMLAFAFCPVPVGH